MVSVPTPAPAPALVSAPAPVPDPDPGRNPISALDDETVGYDPSSIQNQEHPDERQGELPSLLNERRSLVSISNVDPQERFNVYKEKPLCLPSQLYEVIECSNFNMNVEFKNFKAIVIKPKKPGEEPVELKNYDGLLLDDEGSISVNDSKKIFAILIGAIGTKPYKDNPEYSPDHHFQAFLSQDGKPLIRLVTNFGYDKGECLTPLNFLTAIPLVKRYLPKKMNREEYTEYIIRGGKVSGFETKRENGIIQMKIQKGGAWNSFQSLFREYLIMAAICSLLKPPLEIKGIHYCSIEEIEEFSICHPKDFKKWLQLKIEQENNHLVSMFSSKRLMEELSKYYGPVKEQFLKFFKEVEKPFKENEFVHGFTGYITTQKSTNSK